MLRTIPVVAALICGSALIVSPAPGEAADDPAGSGEVFTSRMVGGTWVTGRFRLDGTPAEAEGAERVRPAVTAKPKRPAREAAPSPAAPGKSRPAKTARRPAAGSVAARAAEPAGRAPVASKAATVIKAPGPVPPQPPARTEDLGVQSTSSIRPAPDRGLERLRAALEARARVMSADDPLLSLPVPDRAASPVLPVP